MMFSPNCRSVPHGDASGTSITIRSPQVIWPVLFTLHLSPETNLFLLFLVCSRLSDEVFLNSGLGYALSYQLQGWCLLRD